jgi:hypothetical protein
MPATALRKRLPRSSAHRFPTCGAGVGEVEILHRDDGDGVADGAVQEPGDGVADLGVAAHWWADRVAVLIEAPQRQVAVVEVHTYHRPARPNIGIGARCADSVRRCWRAGPGGGEVAAD